MVVYDGGGKQVLGKTCLMKNNNTTPVSMLINVAILAILVGGPTPPGGYDAFFGSHKFCILNF